MTYEQWMFFSSSSRDEWMSISGKKREAILKALEDDKFLSQYWEDVPFASPKFITTEEAERAWQSRNSPLILSLE